MKTLLHPPQTPDCLPVVSHAGEVRGSGKSLPPPQNTILLEPSEIISLESHRGRLSLIIIKIKNDTCPFF